MGSALRGTDSRGRLLVSNVRKEFATPEGTTVAALDGVSLEVEPGEFFVLLGPSGCGKTTLLRSIAGLEFLDSGEIHLGGTRIDGLPPYRRAVNTVFQSYALFPHLTVAQNIAFGLEMDGMGRREVADKVSEMLELVRLPGLEQRRPSQLSGGQQQRVALARALAKRPAVLLLDEPLAALDLKLRQGMQSELKALQRATGITFVFVTHDQEEALSMGDRIAVFDSGRISQVGTPEDVYERPVNRFVADFIGETSFLEAVVEETPRGPAVRLPGGPLILLADSASVPGSRVSLAVRPERVTFVPDSETAEGAPATVTTVVYMGTDVRAAAVLADGRVISARTPVSARADHLRVGERVRVVIDDGRLRPVADEQTAPTPVSTPAS